MFLTIWVPVEVPRIVGQQGDETPDHTISTPGNEAEPVPCLWQSVAHTHRLRLWRWTLGDDLACDGRALGWGGWRCWPDPLDRAVPADGAVETLRSLPTRATERGQPVG
jgi:hypothetical protein